MIEEDLQEIKDKLSNIEYNLLMISNQVIPRPKIVEDFKPRIIKDLEKEGKPPRKKKKGGVRFNHEIL